MKEVSFKTVKNIFICRICLWCVALASTAYWIYWSFHIYEIHGDAISPEDYAAILRPKMYVGLLIAVVCICISFGLRKKSDRIKDEIKRRVD